MSASRSATARKAAARKPAAARTAKAPASAEQAKLRRASAMLRTLRDEAERLSANADRLLLRLS